MDKKVDTPYGKMSKREDLIWGILIFIFGIGYALARLFFPESEKTIDSIFLLGIGSSFGIFCCIHNLLHAPKVETRDCFEEFEDVVKDYFHDIDTEKEKYRGSWPAVEEWKQKMRERADELKQRFKTEGETEDVLENCDILIEDIENGLCVIQDGNNPLVVKEGKGREPISVFGRVIMPFLILIPSIFLYLVLSTLECGILLLTIAFSCFLFSYDIDSNASGISLFDFTRLRRVPFKFKHLLGIIFISVIGYYLNQWTYDQSGEIQLAITIGLPILYGLIYYKLHHKKQVREI